MTTLFPRLGSPELEPYVVPFGRMMLAFGRAQEAITQLAIMECTKEVEARAYTAGTTDLPKKMRRLFRGRIDDELFQRMNSAIHSFREIAERRHYLVHGEWWFNIFVDNELQIRRVRNGTIEFFDAVTPTILQDWAVELSHIADEVEFVEQIARRKRETDRPFENIVLQAGLPDRR